MRWAVVTASNRPESLLRFQEAWAPLFEKHAAQWIVVFDGEKAPKGLNATVFTWNDVQDWMPRKSDAIRSYGFHRASELECKYVATLDDDVLPGGTDLFAEYESVFELGVPVSDYLDVGALTNSAVQMRGFPHGQRERRTVAVQYGGWSGVLDYDAATQLAGVPEHAEFQKIVLPIPVGCAVTGCNMNMAWRSEYTPLVWQLPIFKNRYQRWGDIWGGLLTKKACDLTGLAVVVNGRAQVLHERASDPQVNLVKEAPGLQINETMWGWLDGTVAWSDPLDSYKSATDNMAHRFDRDDPAYAKHFRMCRDEWLALFGYPLRARLRVA